MRYADAVASITFALALAAGCGSDLEKSEGSSMSSAGDSDSGDESGGPAPSNCGWSGSAYACSFMGEDPGGTPRPCPGPQEAGTCSAQDPLQSCCDAEGNAWQCTCDGQACDYAWTRHDCQHAPGAGACGWWAEYAVYACGGDGDDPEGTPMACSPDLVAGQPCTPADDLRCCDDAGDLWECWVDEFGEASVWVRHDC